MPQIIRYMVVASGAVLIAGALQLSLGCSILIVAMAVSATLVGLWTFVVLGAHRPESWVVLFYALGNFGLALIAKTILGQALSSYLKAPELAYGITFVAIVACAFAAFVGFSMPVGRRIYRPITNPVYLERFAVLTFLAGLGFWLINLKVLNPTGSGFGGLMVFNDLVYMGVVAETARLTIRSTDRLISVRLLLMISIIVGIGLVYDRKLTVFMPIVCYFVSVYAFGGRFGVIRIGAVATIGVLFIAIGVPVIQYYRYEGIERMSLEQKAVFVTSTLDYAVASAGNAQFQARALSAFRRGYYAYYHNYRLQPVLGRFSSIQQVDPVVAAARDQGHVGRQFLLKDIKALLPSTLVRKSRVPAEFDYVRHYNLVPQGAGKYPTVPIAAEAFASYGWFGLVTIVFGVFLAVFWLLKKLSGGLTKNIYGVYFLCLVPFFFAHNQNFRQLLGFIVREVPALVLALYILALPCRSRLVGTRGDPASAK